MATLKELRDERLRKLAELKELGVNPYPAHVNRSHTLSQVVSDFEELNNKPVTVAGRIVNIRKFGSIAFIVIKDAGGQLQLFLSGDKVQEIAANDSQLGFAQLPLLDSGDFIEAFGEVVKTKTGEISVDVNKLRLLTKSLRPLPTKQDGFTNKEERFRRRYIDLNVNKDVYDRFVRRSKFWQSSRDFLNKHDFIEINTPVLEHTTGGADATPFVTHMNALDQDFYLRISHELTLKRLIGGGYEKVFDIGPRFRNENYSDEHLPEHVAMEWYWAYADWRDGMKLQTEMFRHIIKEAFGKRTFEINDTDKIDLGSDGEDWPRISFIEVIKKEFNIDVFDSTMDE